MTPLDETKEIGFTISGSAYTKYIIKNISSNLDDLQLLNFKPELTIQYKKRRNKMKHLTPKKKKRKSK